jgi:hypothetical protein
MVIKVLALIIAAIIVLGVAVIVCVKVYDTVAEANASRKVRKLNRALDDLEGN